MRGHGQGKSHEEARQQTELERVQKESVKISWRKRIRKMTRKSVRISWRKSIREND